MNQGAGLSELEGQREEKDGLKWDDTLSARDSTLSHFPRRFPSLKHFHVPSKSVLPSDIFIQCCLCGMKGRVYRRMKGEQLPSHDIFFFCRRNKRENIRKIKLISICCRCRCRHQWIIFFPCGCVKQGRSYLSLLCLAAFAPMLSALSCHSIRCRPSLFLSAHVLQTLSARVTVSLHPSLPVSLQTLLSLT